MGSASIPVTMAWNPSRGGYERGKDYNHSTFCDLILSGLLGIERKDGKLTCHPLIPEEWDAFCVKGLTEEKWNLYFDRTGERYGKGKGICWERETDGGEKKEAL